MYHKKMDFFSSISTTATILILIAALISLIGAAIPTSQVNLILCGQLLGTSGLGLSLFSILFFD